MYTISKNTFPQQVWSGGMSPHRCAWWCTYYGVVVNGSCVCCCHLLSIVVDFILLFNVYWFLFLVDRWYLLSRCSLYWFLLVFSFLFFVECNKCTIDFDSPPALVSLQHIRVQVKLLFLARAGFSHSRLDVFEFQTWTIFLLILVS